MWELSIDIETYSSVDLVKSGVYAYTSAPDFQILLFAYAFEDEPVTVIDLTSEALPPEIEKALVAPDIVKTAYNANFERTCIQKYFRLELPVGQWRCSAVAASELGLPQTLAGVAEALGLSKQKDSRGKLLINYFSKPCKPTETNGGRTRNLPEHDREKWQTFIEYCRQDVEVERAIKRRIAKFPIKAGEQQLWEYDQRINDRGVRVDLTMVRNAILFNQWFVGACREQAKKITGLENPNSLIQLKGWIEERTGMKVKSLRKDDLEALIPSVKDEKVKEVLELRQKTSKTSTAKYEAMERSVCPDGRIRGMLQFYGANRTGRWAGRTIQPQNLPQNHMKDLDSARKNLIDGDYELFEMLYGNVPQVLSELTRTAIIPSDGRRFIVSDFSAIEARVLSYLADETWRLEVFRTHGKIYEASAAQMFKVPAESIKKGDPLRQKGKIAELALGYGGSVGAMISMGALKQGLQEEELQPIVDSWRAANPRIKAFWQAVEKAALDAVEGKASTLPHGLSFIKQSGILFVGLPSGRRIAYVKPRIAINKYGRKALTYEGMNQTKKSWERIETFGGKLVENIVQAFSRDCLAESIIRLEDLGYEVNFHVHDEVILDVPVGRSSAEEVAEIMAQPISWAPGLPLKADAYETLYYKKD